MIRSASCRSWPVLLPAWLWSALIPDIFSAEAWNFSWADLLPDWDWGDIIPALPIFTSDGKGREPPPMGPAAPRRALGGSVLAGRLYQVNEEGVELFQPARDGRIVPHRDLRRPGAARPSIQIGEITVNAAPGMDARDVAREVRRQLEDMARRPNVALHDGGGSQ